MINPEENVAQEGISSGGIMLPQGESEFTRDSEDKNFVKVIMDDEHNKAFIAEMNEKLKACATEQDEDKLKTMFKNMTGVDFDTICPPDLESNPDVTSENYLHVEDNDTDENKPDPKLTTSETPAIFPEFKDETESSKVSSENDTSVREVPVSEEDEQAERDKEYHNKTLEQLDDYLVNPEKLRFTDDEIKDMQKLGAFDRDTIAMFSKQINEDVDAIISGAGNPMSPYYTEEARRNAIKDTLEIKVRAQEALDAAKDFVDSGGVETVFKTKYPEYSSRGPAWILESFAKYLNDRMSTDEAKSFLYREINNQKKIQSILDNAASYIFKGMLTSNNTQYTIGSFIGGILRWNKSRLALLTGITEEEVTVERFSSLVLIFIVLFIRQWYKKYTPDIQSSSLERRLFYQFVQDNANPLTLTGEKTEWLDDAWNKVWEICAIISNESTAALKAAATSKS